MTLQGGPIAPLGYPNLTETDRFQLWATMGKREGALSGFTIAAAGSGMGVTIQPGEAIVKGDSATTQGAYFVWDTSVYTATLGAASAQPRIDALVLAVGDTQYGTLGTAMGGTQGPRWVVVAGTAAASPVAPLDSAIQTAVGAGGWIRWANVRVDPGNTTVQAANITRLAPAAIPNFPSLLASQRPLPQEGVAYYESDTDTLMMSDGAAWWPVAKANDRQMGRTTITTDSVGQATITFPVAFPTVPYVTANVMSGGVGASILSVAADSFRIQCWHWSSGLIASSARTILWQAMR